MQPCEQAVSEATAAQQAHRSVVRLHGADPVTERNAARCQGSEIARPQSPATGAHHTTWIEIPAPLSPVAHASVELPLQDRRMSKPATDWNRTMPLVVTVV